MTCRRSSIGRGRSPVQDPRRCVTARRSRPLHGGVPSRSPPARGYVGHRPVVTDAGGGRGEDRSHRGWPDRTTPRCGAACPRGRGAHRRDGRAVAGGGHGPGGRCDHRHLHERACGARAPSRGPWVAHLLREAARLHLPETLELVERIDAAGVPVQVGFQRRFDPAISRRVGSWRRGNWGRCTSSGSSPTTTSRPRMTTSLSPEGSSVTRRSTISMRSAGHRRRSPGGLPRGRRRTHARSDLALVRQPLRGRLPGRARGVPSRGPWRDPEPVHRARRARGDANLRRGRPLAIGESPGSPDRGLTSNSILKGGESGRSLHRGGRPGPGSQSTR
ncbi:hypothetical protein BH23CHL8_BH23CHL8_08300 [soil metagenome]